jgi:hypothetical protein
VERTKDISNYFNLITPTFASHPPYEGDGDDSSSLAVYTMLKELDHITEDLSSKPKYRETLRAYYKEDGVDRLYGE